MTIMHQRSIKELAKRSEKENELEEGERDYLIKLLQYKHQEPW
jgi:hypothetical protein